MNDDIKKLLCKTTIAKVFNKNTDRIEFGDDLEASHYRKFPTIKQVDLTLLEQYWQNKWNSFGDIWNEERQNYRCLFDTFQMFYYSFYLLKKYKDTSDTNKENYTMLSAVNLFGVYNYGKKCIDLIKELQLKRLLYQTENDYITNFKMTRNKLLEHNYNPDGFELKIQPSIWSLASTSSILDIKIHGKIESEYDVEIDYYDDYYRLENILVKIIKGF